MALKEAIRKALSASGYCPVKVSFFEMIKQQLEAAQDTIKLLDTNAHSIAHLSLVLEDLKRDNEAIGLARYLAHSRSQLGQDLFVLSQMRSHPDAKFFVEFGATDGVTLSNTHLLEKHFGWQGILAEPATHWHSSLRQNRECVIDHRCIYNETGCMIDFQEVSSLSSDIYATPELSSIASYAENGDWASAIRRDNSRVYPVETLSLNDLLVQYQAPYEIGYLSIDTEGSELDILKAFDFQAHKVHVITVEHNFQSAVRDGLHALLAREGYKRVYEQISGWDDWYVLTEHS